MNFKENLHFMLESRGMQIKELSLLTGISENTIKSYLKENSAEPTLAKALKIAQALNVNLEYLAIGEVEPPKKNYPEIKELQTLIDKLYPNELKILLDTAKSLAENRMVL